MSIETPSAAARQPDAIESFVASLLADQGQLQTPVARFSALKDRGVASFVPTTLIPLSAPRPGEQYAFQVDLDACSGCKACVSACHSLNGLDENESWRDVGLIHGTANGQAYQQTITSACHHCTDPGCLNGCPVAAYEKDPTTGVVRHLDDQCIGCSYCTLTCPYDVPKYNSRLGIVRKCDMCHQRLDVGEAPACAQACPTQAIRIITVSKAEPNRAFLPQAPDSRRTEPTTRYVSTKEIPLSARAADDMRQSVQPSHWPLALMLVLTQGSLGALVGAPLLDVQRGSEMNWPGFGRALSPLATAAFCALLAGLAASALHLGKPARAWRFFLGLGSSWLSREILLFGAVVPLAALVVAWPQAAGLRWTLGVAGLVAIGSSVMIYGVTGRREWTPFRVGTRFFGTSLVTALALHAPAVALLALAAKLTVEISSLRGRTGPSLLLRGPLRPLLIARLMFAIAFAIALPQSPYVALSLLLAGEVIERLLFFMAVDVSKMPGHPAPL